MFSLNITIDAETAEEMNMFVNEVNECLLRSCGCFIPSQRGCYSNPPSEEETELIGEDVKDEISKSPEPPKSFD